MEKRNGTMTGSASTSELHAAGRQKIDIDFDLKIKEGIIRSQREDISLK